MRVRVREEKRKQTARETKGYERQLMKEAIHAPTDYGKRVEEQ